jgi:hypothetical protein
MSQTFFLKNFSNNLGVFGYLLGFYSGFIIRDEYNFPTIHKMDEILINFKENTQKIAESKEKALFLLNKPISETNIVNKIQ